MPDKLNITFLFLDKDISEDEMAKTNKKLIEQQHLVRVLRSRFESIKNS